MNITQLLKLSTPQLNTPYTPPPKSKRPGRIFEWILKSVLTGNRPPASLMFPGIGAANSPLSKSVPIQAQNALLYQSYLQQQLGLQGFGQLGQIPANSVLNTTASIGHILEGDSSL